MSVRRGRRDSTAFRDSSGSAGIQGTDCGRSARKRTTVSDSPTAGVRSQGRLAPNGGERPRFRLGFWSKAPDSSDLRRIWRSGAVRFGGDMQKRHLLARPLGASHSPLGRFPLLSPRLSRLDAPRPAPAAVMRQEPARRPSSRASGAPHSITSSARARIDCGTVRPSTFAVLRLITSLNVVGRWTGRSAGLAPFRILPA
jgi:hypothetical protein